MAQNTVIGNQRRNCLSGFTYMGLLMVMAIASIGMAGVGVVWHQEMQREREKELLFIGEQYRQAIGRYYESPTSGSKQYPEKLEDLLLDKRGPIIQRHLRQLYADPMQLENPLSDNVDEIVGQTTAQAWGLVKQQNQIIGVYSRSQQTPIKKVGFPVQYDFFAEAKTYEDWKFMYSPLASTTAASNPTQVPIEIPESENAIEGNASNVKPPTEQQISENAAESTQY
jgi:type II secretory pathway pseudopilin PulG